MFFSQLGHVTRSANILKHTAFGEFAIATPV